jgi:DNA-binding MarR family transcriptional regulator
MAAARATVASAPVAAAAAARRTKAAPAAPCTCGRLRRATRALTQLYDDAMAPSGLHVTQFSLLRTLAREGPLWITELAAATLVDRTALSRNLDPLIARGLVTVIPGRDARTREVALSAAGRAAIRAAEPHWKRAQAAVARRIGPGRLETLIATLADIETLHPGAPGRDA